MDQASLSSLDFFQQLHQQYTLALSRWQGQVQSLDALLHVAWGSYELNQALTLALQQPDMEAQWLAHGDPFGAAQVVEVDATEMAQTFDALKAL
jgi:hypothetical protein